MDRAELRRNSVEQKRKTKSDSSSGVATQSRGVKRRYASIEAGNNDRVQQNADIEKVDDIDEQRANALLSSALD